MLTTTDQQAIADKQFDDWWNMPGDWVEPPNQRRGGESGVRILQPDAPTVCRLYCKRQVGHLYRSLLHPCGQPTVLREQAAYQAFATLHIRTPRLLYCAARKQGGQWQGLLITEALEDGFSSLEQWSENNASGGLVFRQAVLQQLGIALAGVHLSRWQHGCCYPKHLFVKASQENNAETQVSIAFIDLEKSRQRWRFQDASRHDLQQLWRHWGKKFQDDWALMLKAYRQRVDAA